MIHTMFIHTADQNYIGARSAFFERRDYDFWWLTLHAVEKYLKAAILLNGHPAKQPNHNLTTLLNRIRSIDARLTLPDFIRPKLAGDVGAFEENRPFVRRLNSYGNPANRYASYSYVLSDVDIFQADHLVYWARRHARVLQQTLTDGSRIDWVAELASNPGLWVLHDGSPLEKIANGSLSSAAAKPLVRGNVAFFPNRRHQPLRRRGTRILNGPFYNMLSALRDSAVGSEERAEMRATLEWAVENIYMPKADLERVKELLLANP